MKPMVCMSCYNIGPPKKQIRGSKALLYLSYLIFPLNLLISFFRATTKYKVCRKCGSRNLKPESELDDELLMKIMRGETIIDNHPQTDPKKTSYEEFLAKNGLGKEIISKDKTEW